MTSYHPKHRTPARLRVLRKATAVGGVAAVATSIAAGGALLSGSTPVTGSAAALSASTPATVQHLSQADLAEREQRASRSEDDRRPLTDAVKARALSNASGPARTHTEDLSQQDPRSIAKALMPQFGMAPSDFSCVDNVWSQESGWNVHADNPTSSAYGIPQALPGSKMSTAGPDWQNNPVTQIKWGLGYMKSRYGGACGAWAVKQRTGVY